MRLAGAAALILAFGMFGYAQVQSARSRERLLGAMCSALELLRGEITNRLTPLPDCARMLAEGGPEPCRGFFRDVYAGCGALGEVEFSGLWSACLAALDVPEAARLALDDLGRSLGRYSADEQRTAIDRCLEALERCLGEARASDRQSSRLRMGLSLTAGMLLAVILY